MGRWDGKHLRVTYPMVSFPWITPYTDSATGWLKLHGNLGSLIGNITAYLNMTYEAVPTLDGQYGIPDPDPEQLDGQLAMIWHKYADIAIGPWIPNELTMKYLHMTPVIGEMNLAMWQGMQKTFETRSTPYVKAFDVETWIFLGSCILILTLLCIVEDLLINRLTFSFTVISNNILIMIQTLLQESTKNRFMTVSTRIVGGAWILTTLVLMTYFSGELKANSVVRSPTLRINNYDDLYHHRHTHKLIYPDDSPAMIIMVSAAGEFEDQLMTSMDEGIGKTSATIYEESSMEELFAGRAVIIGEEVTIYHLSSVYCGTTKDQFFHVSSEGIPKLFPSMGIAPHIDPELIEKFDRSIRTSREMAVPYVTEMEMHPGSLNCLASTKRSIEINTLTFANVQFSFESHLVALLLCVLVFFAEIIWFHWSAKEGTHVRIPVPYVRKRAKK